MALAGDHVQVIVNGYDLTGDSNKISINDSRTMLDASSFGDTVQKFIPGQRKASINHNGYFDALDGRSHPALKDAEIQGVVTVFLGQNNQPAPGDPVYSLLMRQGQYQPRPQVGQIIPFSASFASVGMTGGWGVALTPPVSINATTTGVAVDGGAESTEGGAAYLHVLAAAASDTYSVTVESSNSPTFASGVTTLATFTLTGAALGSERIALTGSIGRYTRYKATRIGSAGNLFRFAVTLVRF